MTDTETYNPADHTVDEVNAYLAEHPDEVGAVLTAEENGEGRKGILEGPHATPADETTEGKTFTEAAKDVKPLEGEHYQRGYIGEPPSKAKGQDLSVAGVTGKAGASEED